MQCCRSSRTTAHQHAVMGQVGHDYRLHAVLGASLLRGRHVCDDVARACGQAVSPMKVAGRRSCQSQRPEWGRHDMPAELLCSRVQHAAGPSCSRVSAQGAPGLLVLATRGLAACPGEAAWQARACQHQHGRVPRRRRRDGRLCSHRTDLRQCRSHISLLRNALSSTLNFGANLGQTSLASTWALPSSYEYACNKAQTRLVE